MILESRKFLGPGGSVMWLRLSREEDVLFPFRVRMRGVVGGSGALATCETEEQGRSALERRTTEARARGWRLVPVRLRLALEIPEAGGAAQAAGVPVRVGTNPVAALPASEGAGPGLDATIPEAKLPGVSASPSPAPVDDVPAGIGPVGSAEGTPSAEPALESDCGPAGPGATQDSPARPAAVDYNHRTGASTIILAPSFPACVPEYAAEYHANLGRALRQEYGDAALYCGGCGETLP